MRRRTWSGDRVGLGVSVDADVNLKVHFGGANPRIVETSSRDVVASGGLLSAGDIKVGPLTPACLAAVSGATGGHGFGDIDPMQALLPTEVLFLVFGPGHPAAGTSYRRVEGSRFRLFQDTIILRAMKARL